MIGGCPVALVPQPAMLMMVVLTCPTLAPPVGVRNPVGLRNSCTNPKIVTGLAGGVPGVLLKTGTVTSESLTITLLPARPGIGLSSPATNWNGALGGAVEFTISPLLVVACVKQFAASAVSEFRAA